MQKGQGGHGTTWVGGRGGWVISVELEPLGLEGRSGDRGLDEMRSEKPTAYFCLGRDLHERRHNFACSTGMEWPECPTGYPSRQWPISADGSPGDWCWIAGFSILVPGAAVGTKQIIIHAAVCFFRCRAPAPSLPASRSDPQENR